jgi:hypothetical protein
MTCSVSGSQKCVPSRIPLVTNGSADDLSWTARQNTAILIRDSPVGAAHIAGLKINYIAWQ